MGKQHDEIMNLLGEIRDGIDSIQVRIDESESNMLEVTGSLSADLRKIIKRADIKKKPTPVSVPTLVDMSDLVRDKE